MNVKPRASCTVGFCYGLVTSSFYGLLFSLHINLVADMPDGNEDVHVTLRPVRKALGKKSRFRGEEDEALRSFALALQVGRRKMKKWIDWFVFTCPVGKAGFKLGLVVQNSINQILGIAIGLRPKPISVECSICGWNGTTSYIEVGGLCVSVDRSSGLIGGGLT